MKSKIVKVFITLIVLAFLGVAAGCSGGGDAGGTSSAATSGTLTGSGE